MRRLIPFLLLIGCTQAPDEPPKPPKSTPPHYPALEVTQSPNLVFGGEWALPLALGPRDFAVTDSFVFVADKSNEALLRYGMDGYLDWVLPIIDPPRNRTFPTAVEVVADSVFVITTHGTLFCYDLDGNPRWQTPTPMRFRDNVQYMADLRIIGDWAWILDEGNDKLRKWRFR